MVTNGLTVRIRGLGSSGDGVATLPDGRTVFVPRTAVGDVVEIALERERPKWARGRVVRVHAPSEDRRDAPCPLYDRCGGCQIQHVTYESQLIAKHQRVADALERIGGIATLVEPVRPSPSEFHYRSRVRFHVRRGARGQVHGGFYPAGQSKQVVEVRNECLLIDSVLQSAWTSLRRAWGSTGELLPRGPELELLLRALEGGVALSVYGGSRWSAPEALLDAVPQITAIWWAPGVGSNKSAASQDLQHVAGSKQLEESWNGEELRVGASGFLQANREGARTLWDMVAREVGPPRGRRIVDAYCGLGVYGRLLARHGADVTGIELDPHAAKAAALGAPSGFSVKTGRVEQLLPGVLPADVLLVNPPRQGMDEPAVAAVVAAPPDRLVYVSCDPATLARDLSRMAQTHEVIRLQPIDLFPQTSHVETVATVVRLA